MPSMRSRTVLQWPLSCPEQPHLSPDITAALMNLARVHGPSPHSPISAMAAGLIALPEGDPSSPTLLLLPH